MSTDTTDSWKFVDTDLPDPRRPIIMTGRSGYIEPHHIFYISGKYDPEYRPLSPWLDSTNTCLEDKGWKPFKWMYVTDLEERLWRLEELSR